MIDSNMYTNQGPIEGHHFEIHLGSGRNLHDILLSSATRTPAGLEVYIGNDHQTIPSEVLGDSNDLVIHLTSGMHIAHISVKYLDTTTGTYVGPIYPVNFIITADQEWGLWKNFSDIVIPHSSIITIVASDTLGSHTSGDGSTGSNSPRISDQLTDADVAVIAQKVVDILQDSNSVNNTISPDKVIFTKDVLTNYEVGNVKLTDGVGTLAKSGDSLLGMLEKVWLRA